MFVLGVNISHHPSVCLLDDGEIVYYLEDDRLNRNKEQDWEYNDPMRCLTHVRQYTEHLDHIIFCSYIKNKWSQYRDDLTIDQVKRNLKLYGITYDEEYYSHTIYFIGIDTHGKSDLIIKEIAYNSKTTYITSCGL